MLSDLFVALQRILTAAVTASVALFIWVFVVSVCDDALVPDLACNFQSSWRSGGIENGTANVQNAPRYRLIIITP